MSSPCFMLNSLDMYYLQERLMTSILPEHIVSKVRQDVRTMYLGLQTHNISYRMRSFR